MKKIFSLILVLLLLLSLCACGKDDGNTNNTITTYSVEDQEMFNFDGIRVSVVPGKYTGEPEFHVTNTSGQDRWVVLDAVAYDNVLQPNAMSNVGTVYKVLAGADQKLSECEKYGSLVFQYVTVAPDGFISNGTATDSTSGTGPVYNFSVNTGININFVTNQTVIKREYRFAVYSIDPDSLPETGKNFVPNEDDLLHRTDLILLQSSIYDESKVSKPLPTDDPLFASNGITIWRNSTSYTASGSEGMTIQLQTSPSFLIDNASDADIRVEITLTPDPNQPIKDANEGKDEGKDNDKDDGKKEDGEKEPIPDPTSYFLFSEIPAGLASRNINSSGNAKIPSWLTSGGLIMNVRIYDLATGDLILEDTVSVE